MLFSFLLNYLNPIQVICALELYMSQICHELNLHHVTSSNMILISILTTLVAELGRLFPSIPLVAEEDSAFLRSNNLANSVLDVVADKAEYTGKPLKEADVLEAIDRGGKDAFVFGSSPATYWVNLCMLVTFLWINLEQWESSYNN